MNLRYAAIAAGLALVLMSGGAQAAYIINFQQEGADVVASGSGSINTSGLKNYPGVTGSGYPGINDYYAYISFGDYGIVDSVYSGITGPSTFGSISSFQGAAFTSGNKLQIEGGVDPSSVLPELEIYEGYVSGSDLGLSTDTFSDTTLAGLGLTNGKYVYTFGSGINADSLTVLIGVGTVPLPPALPMFGAALLALGAVGYDLKRKGMTVA